MAFTLQVALLFVLALPVACVAWTVTHEEVFRELREWCVVRSKTCQGVCQRKFFYLFTCEYCFSHWVAAGLLALTDYRLWLQDWRGLVLAGFSLVAVANVYMSLFEALRLRIRLNRHEESRSRHMPTWLR